MRGILHPIYLLDNRPAERLAISVLLQDSNIRFKVKVPAEVKQLAEKSSLAKFPIWSEEGRTPSPSSSLLATETASAGAAGKPGSRGWRGVTSQSCNDQS